MNHYPISKLIRAIANDKESRLRLAQKLKGKHTAKKLRKLDLLCETGRADEFFLDELPKALGVSADVFWKAYRKSQALISQDKEQSSIPVLKPVYEDPFTANSLSLAWHRYYSYISMSLPKTWSILSKDERLAALKTEINNHQKRLKDKSQCPFGELLYYRCDYAIGQNWDFDKNGELLEPEVQS